MATAQEAKSHKVSYSFSWTPVYYGPNDRKFRLDDVLSTNFEANVYYKLKNRISISSGIGLQNWQKTYLSWSYSSMYDPSKSERHRNTTVRIPLQLNYYLTDAGKGITPYLKTEFINEFQFIKARYYQDDILVDFNTMRVYSNSINFGIGALISTNKSIMLLTEGSLGTYLYHYPFDGYQIRLKIGIMFR
jgi:hypothetical protein